MGSRGEASRGRSAVLVLAAAALAVLALVLVRDDPALRVVSAPGAWGSELPGRYEATGQVSGPVEFVEDATLVDQLGPGFSTAVEEHLGTWDVLALGRVDGATFRTVYVLPNRPSRDLAFFVERDGRWSPWTRGLAVFDDEGFRLVDVSTEAGRAAAVAAAIVREGSGGSGVGDRAEADGLAALASFRRAP